MRRGALLALVCVAERANQTPAVSDTWRVPHYGGELALCEAASSSTHSPKAHDM